MTNHGARGQEWATEPLAARPARRRHRWLLPVLAAVVVLALAGGLLAWAPWRTPPVLRPAGLAAGTATASSVAFRWSRPGSGPLPDQYLIISDGRVASGSVAGTATSYRRAGLTPGTAYQFRVQAVRDGRRSPLSARLTLRTLTPPVSQARLRGSWTVHLRRTGHGPGPRQGTLLWQISPGCPAGPCDVSVRVSDGGHFFTLALKRDGAAYRGQGVIRYARCGPRPGLIADPATLRVRIRVTAAVGQLQTWAATSFTGTATDSTKYVAGAGFYCPASSSTSVLTAAP